jgi:hypothetical protein
MARDSEYFFMCLLAIWIPSFEKVLFSFLPMLSLGHWILGSFLISFYILIIKSLSDV